MSTTTQSIGASVAASRRPGSPAPVPQVVTASASGSALAPEAGARVNAPGVAAFKDRRRRRRVDVAPMYTSLVVRPLARRQGPLEGHVVNLSETGMMAELDEILPIGQPVAVEFSVAGLGLFRHEAWPTFSLAAEVVRLDDFDDFPQGPYKVALRFERVPTMVQAQIVRFTMNVPA